MENETAESLWEKFDKTICDRPDWNKTRESRQVVKNVTNNGLYYNDNVWDTNPYIITGTTIPVSRLGAQNTANPVTTFDIEKMKEQLREEIMKELNENQMLQQPLVTGPRYIICKNSKAYICSLTDYLGDTDNWKEIRTTHENKFTASDEFFMSNKNDPSY